MSEHHARLDDDTETTDAAPLATLTSPLPPPLPQFVLDTLDPRNFEFDHADAGWDPHDGEGEGDDDEGYSTPNDDDVDEEVYGSDGIEDGYAMLDYDDVGGGTGAQAGQDLTKRLNRAKNEGSAAGMVGGRAGVGGAGRIAVKDKAVGAQAAARHDARERNYESLVKKYGARLRMGDDLPSPSSTSSTAQSVPGSLSLHDQRASAAASSRKRDRADRATVEGVLDKRTRAVLLKLVGAGVVDVVEGCVSTGKEANVYHALAPPTTTPSPTHLALKIYRTSVLSFRDRDRYVTGEHRFRNGYAKGNARKMVTMWAEKEARNLQRLARGGVKCPGGVSVRGNVVVMQLVGVGESPAPRLKDAPLTPREYRACYTDLLKTVWKMYNRCALVHADLSEYNILYHDAHPYIIDVSQSVAPDHPHALEFLRRDCANVVAFFGPRCVGAEDEAEAEGEAEGEVEGGEGADAGEAGESGEGEDHEESERKESAWRVMTPREMFEFVVSGISVLRDELGGTYLADPAPTTGAGGTGAGTDKDDEEVEGKARWEVEEQVLDAWLDKFHSAPPTAPTTDQTIADQVFMQSFIPRTLNEVRHVERDAEKVVRGEGGDLIYSKIARVHHEPGPRGPTAAAVAAGGKQDVRPAAEANGKASRSRAGKGDREDEESDVSDFGSESESESGSGSGEDGEDGAPRSRLKKHEDKESKKERKQAFKEAKREKRKQKVPKAEKKKKEKARTEGRKGR